MPNITNCTRCQAIYEAGSEEQANEHPRFCGDCRKLIGVTICPECYQERRRDEDRIRRGFKCRVCDEIRALRDRSHQTGASSSSVRRL